MTAEMETSSYLVSGLERRPCRVCKVCEAWSASVREIHRGNVKQRELRDVAYNGSDGSRVWAYYETVYIA